MLCVGCFPSSHRPRSVARLTVEVQHLYNKRYDEDTKERADECCSVYRYEHKRYRHHQKSERHASQQTAKSDGKKLILVPFLKRGPVREQARRRVKQGETNSNPKSEKHRVGHVVSPCLRLLERNGRDDRRRVSCRTPD